MAVQALRGAVTIEADTKELVGEATIEMLTAIFDLNDLHVDQVISALFTATPDIRSVAPGVAARKFGLTEVPLICAAEMPVEGSLELCLRVMLHVDTDRPRSELRHAFLGGATVLRPDLAGAEASGDR